jgi:hypothetical protein
MRRIMVDHARARHALKCGAGAIRVTLDETALVTEERAEELRRLMKRWKSWPSSIAADASILWPSASAMRIKADRERRMLKSEPRVIIVML